MINQYLKNIDSLLKILIYRYVLDFFSQPYIYL